MSELRKTYHFFIAIHVLFFSVFFALADESGNVNSFSKPRAISSNSNDALDSENVSDFTHNAYLYGDIDLLSGNAPVVVRNVSDKIYRATKIRTMLYIVKKTPSYVISNSESNINQKFKDRRAYETKMLDGLRGQYAAIFLFYDDHAITLRSNLDFLDKKTLDVLLERYAYPYLPADSVGTSRYDDGVNEGVSNLYLALTNTIADHYHIDLRVPKPMEQTEGATKVILYVMLLILIVLFIVVRFGLGSFNKRV